MVAGFIVGWMQKRDYEHAFRMSLPVEVPALALKIWQQDRKLKRNMKKPQCIIYNVWEGKVII